MGIQLYVTLFLGLSGVAMAGDPYLFFNWNVTYGNIAPLGVPKQGILINGKFPGPKINCTSNNNIVINVFNNIDEPLLLTWAGIQQRKNSWQDGTLGTMCPIQPGTNYTYRFQVKDQIGTFFYFPTTGIQRSAGAIGMIKVHSRPLIPIPYDRPAAEFSVLLGDWYNMPHKELRDVLNSGESIGKPDGVQINGRSDIVGDLNTKPLFTMNPGKTYKYRVCNVGMKSSINFRFQGHTMKLVEMEGSHTVQNIYDSIDIHVGQCMAVLVTADRKPKDYYLVASSRFSKKVLQSVALVRYSNGKGVASPDLPPPPPEDSESVAWSINQFRSFRWNLTASAARPNPQGSYHYGKIKISRTIKIENSFSKESGKLRFALNNVSHRDLKAPIKLIQHFGSKRPAFTYDLAVTKKAIPADRKMIIAPSVVNVTFKNFVEIVFENNENTIQTYHLDGYSFFPVGIEAGRWTSEQRKFYNLVDAVSRNTIQVYPKSWTAVFTTMDNVGLWNLRSENQERAYLGQQLYFNIPQGKNHKHERDIPHDQIFCGAYINYPRPTTAPQTQ